MRTLGYARVSTREQALNSNALEQQIARIVAAGVAEEDVLFDVERGKKTDRKNFSRMMELVRTKQVDKVVFTRVDRFGRKTARSLDWIEEFGTAKVIVQFLDQNIDTTTSQGKIQLEMYCMMASSESYMLSDRVSHGWQHTRNQAKAVKPPFGYRVEKSKYVLDDPEDPEKKLLSLIATRETFTPAQLAKELIDTFLKLKSLTGTIREINLKYGIQKFAQLDEDGNVIDKPGNRLKKGFHWSKTGLSDWLHNPILQGHSCYLRRKERRVQDKEKWDLKPDTHPDQALLTPQQYEEIKSILESNKMNLRTSGTNRQYAIAGLIFCANCGAKFYSTCGKKRKSGIHPRYFQCRNYQERACTNQKLIRGEKVEEAILKALVNRQFDIQDELDELDKEIASRPQEVEEKLAELREQVAVLSAMKGNPAITQALNTIENQIKVLELRSEYKRVSKVSARQYLNSPEIQQAIEAGTLFDNANATTLHKLIKAVRVRDGEVEAVEFSGQDW